jgi:hypothetical protein
VTRQLIEDSWPSAHDKDAKSLGNDSAMPSGQKEADCAFLSRKARYVINGAECALVTTSPMQCGGYISAHVQHAVVMGRRIYLHSIKTVTVVACKVWGNIQSTQAMVSTSTPSDLSPGPGPMTRDRRPAGPPSQAHCRLPGSARPTRPVRLGSETRATDTVAAGLSRVCLGRVCS